MHGILYRCAGVKSLGIQPLRGLHGGALDRISIVSVYVCVSLLHVSASLIVRAVARNVTSCALSKQLEMVLLLLQLPLVCVCVCVRACVCEGLCVGVCASCKGSY